MRGMKLLRCPWHTGCCPASPQVRNVTPDLLRGLGLASGTAYSVGSRGLTSMACRGGGPSGG